jgi:hypothetical protein
MGVKLGLVLSDERKLRMFEERALRQTGGLRGDRGMRGFEIRTGVSCAGRVVFCVCNCPSGPRALVTDTTVRHRHTDRQTPHTKRHRHTPNTPHTDTHTKHHSATRL